MWALGTVYLESQPIIPAELLIFYATSAGTRVANFKQYI